VINILIDALTNPARLLEGSGIPAISGDQMRKLLGRAAGLAAALRRAPEERAKIVRELVEQVIINEKQIVIKLLHGVLLGGEVPSRASDAPGASTIAGAFPHGARRAIRDGDGWTPTPRGDITGGPAEIPRNGKRDRPRSGFQ